MIRSHSTLAANFSAFLTMCTTNIAHTRTIWILFAHFPMIRVGTRSPDSHQCILYTLINLLNTATAAVIDLLQLPAGCWLRQRSFPIWTASMHSHEIPTACDILLHCRRARRTYSNLHSKFSGEASIRAKCRELLIIIYAFFRFTVSHVYVNGTSVASSVCEKLKNKPLVTALAHSLLIIIIHLMRRRA